MEIIVLFGVFLIVWLDTFSRWRYSGMVVENFEYVNDFYKTSTALEILLKCLFV